MYTLGSRWFRWGEVILTGVSVDPGFGLQQIEGRWVSKDDERLHFVLANVGPNDVTLQPGIQAIATLQLVEVSGIVKEIDVPSTSDMEREFFGDAQPRLGLSFFRDMSELKRQVDGYGVRLEVTEKASNQLVMAGSYVLFAAVVVSALLGVLTLVSSESLERRINAVAIAIPTSWPGALVVATFFFAVGAAFLAATRGLDVILSRIWKTVLRQ